MSKNRLNRLGRNPGCSHLGGTGMAAGVRRNTLNAQGRHQTFKTAAYIAVIQRSTNLGRHKRGCSHGQPFRYNAVDGLG